MNTTTDTFELSSRQTANSKDSFVTMITCEPLTKIKFAPYGSIISPDEEIGSSNDNGNNANQGTAMKVSQVSGIINNTTNITVPNWNLFRCFPQRHLKINVNEKSFKHTVRILERHPFSSQTFVPMGRAADKVSYLVIVALPDASLTKPDLTTVKGFLCKGNQAVTYGAGIWHAPMIVLGEEDYLDFAVLIYETLDPNTPQLDCVEYQVSIEVTNDV